MDKVIGEDERDALTVDSKLGLEIPQEVAKINVEQLRERKGRVKTEREQRGLEGSAWSRAQSRKAKGGARRQALPTPQPHTAPTCPFSRIMMLSLCRSPMPSTYVATQ